MACTLVERISTRVLSMAEESTPSRAQFWTGWVLSAIPALMLFTGAFTALSGAEMVKQGMAPFGIPTTMILWVGLCELLCSLLYLIPRTAPLGAILMTA